MRSNCKFDRTKKFADATASDYHSRYIFGQYMGIHVLKTVWHFEGQKTNTNLTNRHEKNIRKIREIREIREIRVR